MPTKQIPFTKKLLATLAFWGLFFFGPLLLALLNLFSPTPMDEGSLLYLVFSTLSQAISAALGCSAANSICEDRAPLVMGVNAIIASVIVAIMVAMFIFFYPGELQKIISYAATLVVLVGFSWSAFHQEEK